jgi:hypothetical protein
MSGIGNLHVTAGRIGYSYLCRGTQKKKINNVGDSKQNYVWVLLVFTSKLTIAVCLHTTEFIVKTLFVSFQTVLISSHS